MKLRVEPELRRRFPTLAIACLVAEDIDNRSDAATLHAALQAECVRLHERFGDLEALLAHPPLAAWQRTYQAMGLKPKKVMPTAAALARRAYKSGPPPSISAVVDAYLLAELRHFVPIGGHDLDTIEGDIVLRSSAGGERFVAIGGSEGEAEATLAGEVVYADAGGVLTRHWNYRDCERAKIRASTRRLALFAESADAMIDAGVLRAALAEVGESIQAHCGGRFALALLDGSCDELSLG